MNTHSTRRGKTAASRRAAITKGTESPTRIRGTLSLDGFWAAIDAPHPRPAG